MNRQLKTKILANYCVMICKTKLTNNYDWWNKDKETPDTLSSRFQGTLLTPEDKALYHEAHRQRRDALPRGVNDFPPFQTCEKV